MPKTILLIIDGVSDEPLPELQARTPLECAFAPHLNYLASQGQVGRIRTTFDGYPIESMVCIMGLLGYDPRTFYPSGRASFEAMAKGIPLQPGDLVFRCNTITISEVDQTLTDFTGGLISDSSARRLVSQIELPCPNWELYPGQSYRNVLIIRDAGVAPHDLKCAEPHMHMGVKAQDILVQAKSERIKVLVEQINGFLMGTQSQIAKMDLPAACKANMLWVWSPSSKPLWPSFKERTGLTAAIVGGLDFLHGIAMAARIHFDVIPGATGYIDTNYSAKARYAVNYLDNFDFVLVHINAADEEAHQHNHVGKIMAIEKIDALVLGPLVRALREKYSDNFRIAICGDHMTRCHDGKHADVPVPFVVYGKGIEPSGSNFSERSCASAYPISSLKFLDQIRAA